MRTRRDATLLTALDAAGALDFAELAHQDILRWLQALEHLAAGMPLTDDLAHSGITSDDLDYQKAEEQRQRAERARQQRIVPIDDEPFDLNEGFGAAPRGARKSLERTPAFLGDPPAIRRAAARGRATRKEAVTRRRRLGKRQAPG